MTQFENNLRELGEPFYAHLRALGRAVRTAEGRRDSVYAVCRAIGVLPQDLTRDQLLLHLDNYADESRITYLTALRQYARYAQIPDPTDGIPRPRSPRHLPDPLDEVAFDRLVEHLGETNSRRDLLWVLLGAYCGLRAHEVAKIHTRDFRRLGKTMVCRVIGKGGFEDLVVIPPVVENELPDTSEYTGYLFPSYTKKGHVTSAYVSTRVKERAETIGIGLRFHQLRHLLGTRVHEKRGDLLLTMQVLRHRSPTSTAGYAKVSVKDRFDVISELPGAGAVAVDAVQIPVRPNSIVKLPDALITVPPQRQGAEPPPVEEPPAEPAVPAALSGASSPVRRGAPPPRLWSRGNRASSAAVRRRRRS
ncbi:tyrosine-type recombinase/integrase [Streptomyces sp. cg35]|uniref:tyrosine-type recombinase/integrase n=1 Tax=Streptomyces sp. cg35 TaxID=3421650 RepID=UPI003D16BE4B